jgi:hypothetical protein
MAILSSAKSGASTATALTRERIEQALKRQRWEYQVDADGDVGGFWDGNLFYFFILTSDEDDDETGEVLHIRGRWRGTLDPDLRQDARRVIDAWHRDSFWAKAYTDVDDSGQVLVFAEHAVNCAHGITDDQLLQAIVDALTTAVRFFQELGEHFGQGA